MSYPDHTLESGKAAGIRKSLNAFLNDWSSTGGHSAAKKELNYTWCEEVRRVRSSGDPAGDLPGDPRLDKGRSGGLRWTWRNNERETKLRINLHHITEEESLGGGVYVERGGGRIPGVPPPLPPQVRSEDC
ncbi:hypothetical protein E2C01_102138 [Portunus trituberculatus]|uniref:Uncharacterized protein n=1 Tax=Portunus trituberculatus TaxID=210409 RepID=A0A5B7K7D3_PORTR|nr:hypothetical protein [Portunus trituberculatus]